MLTLLFALHLYFVVAQASCSYRLASPEIKEVDSIRDGGIRVKMRSQAPLSARWNIWNASNPTIRSFRLPDGGNDKIRTANAKEGNDTYIFTISLQNPHGLQYYLYVSMDHPCNTITYIIHTSDMLKTLLKEGVSLPRVTYPMDRTIDLSSGRKVYITKNILQFNTEKLECTFEGMSDLFRRKGHSITANPSGSGFPLWARGYAVLYEWNAPQSQSQAWLQKNGSDFEALDMRSAYMCKLKNRRRTNRNKPTIVMFINMESELLLTEQQSGPASALGIIPDMHFNRIGEKTDDDGVRVLAFWKKPETLPLTFACVGQPANVSLAVLRSVKVNGKVEQRLLTEYQTEKNQVKISQHYAVSLKLGEQADYFCQLADGSDVLLQRIRLFHGERVEVNSDTQSERPVYYRKDADDLYTKDFNFTCGIRSGVPTPKIRFYFFPSRYQMKREGEGSFDKRNKEFRVENVLDQELFYIEDRGVSKTIMLKMSGANPAIKKDEGERVLLCAAENKFSFADKYIMFFPGRRRPRGV